MRFLVSGLLIGCSILLGSTAAMAQAMPADAPNVRDHAAISRYAGSWLVAQESKEFDGTELPEKDGSLVRLEGRITRYFYISPTGKSVLEVQRNYEQALERAGAVKRDGCSESCGNRGFRPIRSQPGNAVMSKGALQGWSAVTLLQQWQETGKEYYWFGTLTAAGKPLHVAVLSAKPGTFVLSSAYVATVVEIVEPKAMDTGKVMVDANALTKGLQAEGKVALYGIYFDTGKSVIKPESKPQLVEMARALQAQPALKVYIVGHTDNQGPLDGNLVLSKARAQAVVDALTGQHAVDGKRLSAAGLAGYAPVAGNADEAGRARNRRVEMVLQ